MKVRRCKSKFKESLKIGFCGWYNMLLNANRQEEEEEEEGRGGGEGGEYYGQRH
jgi:hypothetical protein